MHLDFNNEEVKIGDIVYLPVIVQDMRPGVDYMNLTCKTLHPLFPSERVLEITVNSKQLFKNIPTNQPELTVEESLENEENDF